MWGWGEEVRITQNCSSGDRYSSYILILITILEVFKEQNRRQILTLNINLVIIFYNKLLLILGGGIPVQCAPPSVLIPV